MAYTPGEGRRHCGTRISQPSTLDGAASTEIQDFCWSSAEKIEIPEEDIVSYAFGGLKEFDQEKPIYVEGRNSSHSISRSDARRYVRQIIRGLQVQGLQPGDCVCIHAANNIYYPLLWLGVIGAGACVSGSNPAYTPPELIYHFRITSTKFVIAQVDLFVKNIAEAAKKCQIPDDRVFALGKPEQQLPDGYQSWTSLLCHGEADWQTFGKHNAKNAKSVAVLASTSGTTGLPKAAELSHTALIAACEMIQAFQRRIDGKASQLICLPVFHAFAGPLALILPLRRGTTTYFLPRFNLEEFVRVVDTFSVTETAVVPQIITTLLKLETLRLAHLRSLRYIICAGAPMTADIQKQFSDRLSPEANIVQCWGMTEMAWVSTFDAEERDTSGSVGKLLPNVELKIVDEEGAVITEEGVSGEGYVRSSAVFEGYRQNPDATANAFDKDGFYRTGDCVYVANGKVFITGRLKDIMKVKGWQVSPTELESILLQHPQIADAAVVGLSRRNADGLEEVFPRAYVVRHQIKEDDTSSIVTQEELKTFIKDRVVTYKRLTGGVIFLDKMARSSTGKILRKQLEAITANDTRDTELSRSSTPVSVASYLSASSPPDTQSN